MSQLLWGTFYDIIVSFCSPKSKRFLLSVYELFCFVRDWFYGFVREDANDRRRKATMAAAKKKGGFLPEFEG